MSLNPRQWREAEGLSRARVAAIAAMGGANPGRTYQRYETGENQCPTSVIEAVRKLSGGRVRADDWHALRLSYLADGGNKNGSSNRNGHKRNGRCKRA